MKCQHCDHQLYGLCLKCEKYLFDEQIRVIIDGSAKAILLEEKRKLNDKYKELKERAAQLRFAVVICALIGLALGVYVVYLKGRLPPPFNPPPSNPPIPQLEEKQVGPDEHVVAKVFSLKGERRDVNIGVSVRCPNCGEDSLAMILLDDSNYERFASRMDYEPRYEEVDMNVFGFNGSLEEGVYYLVFQNRSGDRPLSLKIGVDVIYE
jgi:hypothetical protein